MKVTSNEKMIIMMKAKSDNEVIESGIRQESETMEVMSDNKAIR